MKEIKATVQLGTGEEVPENQIEAFNARNKAAQETYLKAAQEKARKPFTLCPFSSALTPTCREDCALRVPAGCSVRFLVDKHPAMRSTEGRRCPISGQPCAPTCALSASGSCVLTSI